MGGIASKLRGSLIQRPLQRYNVEARAEKTLQQQEQGAAVRAPRFPSDQQVLDRLRAEQGSQLQAIHQKDKQLGKRLQEVYVTSTDPAGFDPDALKQEENPERPLPRKLTVEERQVMPEHIFQDKTLKPKRGKASLDDLQEMLSLHKSDARANCPAELARRFQLAEKDVTDLVRHYTIFDMVQGTGPIAAGAEDDPLLPKPDWEEAPPQALPKRVEAARIEGGVGADQRK